MAVIAGIDPVTKEPVPITLEADLSLPVTDKSEGVDQDYWFRKMFLELMAIRLALQSIANERSEEQRDFLEEAIELQEED